MPKLPSEPPPAADDDRYFAEMIKAAEHFDRESPEIALIQSGITVAVEKGATREEIEEFVKVAIAEVFKDT